MASTEQDHTTPAPGADTLVRWRTVDEDADNPLPRMVFAIQSTTPGLVIVPYTFTEEGERLFVPASQATEFSVTHAASGTRVCRAYQFGAACGIADALEVVTDWTAPAERIVRRTVIRHVEKVLREYGEQVMPREVQA